MPTDPIEDLDFKFVDPTNYEDGGASVSEARREQLKQEAVSTGVQAWLLATAAQVDEARAAAIRVAPEPAEGKDDPDADKRAERQRIEAAARATAEQAASLGKSFERRKQRAKDAGASLGPADLKQAKKAFLVGFGDERGGHLQRMEEEFIQHRNLRRRCLQALALTGVLALNEQERAQVEQQVRTHEEAMGVLRDAIKVFRKELKDAGGGLPSKPLA